jgi:hypothetical protein
MMMSLHKLQIEASDKILSLFPLRLRDKRIIPPISAQRSGKFLLQVTFNKGWQDPDFAVIRGTLLRMKRSQLQMETPV